MIFPLLSDIRAAHARIQPFIHRTPILTSEAIDQISGCQLFFKCENFQKVGAFKARGAANAVMTFVVELVEDELDVAPIHRLISDLPDEVDLVAAFDPFFESEPFPGSGQPTVRELQELGGLALVTSEGTWLLRPRPNTIAATRDLDSSRLDLALAALPDHSLVYQHGVDHIYAAVRSGAAQAGVLLRPVRVDQIIEIAEGGEKMPPKSTFFAPKPRTGVVFRSID